MRGFQQTPEPLRLTSGTTLILAPDPTATATAIAVSIRIGGLEQRRQGGIGALLARMLGGDSQGRTPELLQRDVDGFGALGTLYDGSQLLAWSVCPPTEQALVQSAQALLLNTIAQPRFTDEALERARRDQLRALALQEEELVPRLFRALRGRALGLEQSIQGDPATLARLTTDDVQAFYRQFCTPERTTIAVVGRFEPETARRWVETSLSVGDWNQRPAGARELLPTISPIPEGLRDRIVPSLSGISAVAVSYLLPGLSQPEARADGAALQVLDAILGLGKSCRLFRVRDDQALGYEVRSLLQPGREATLWTTYLLGTQPVLTLREGLLATLHAARKAPITESELTRARTLLLAQRSQQRQLVLTRARALTWAETCGQGAVAELEFVRRIEAVKRGDVERVAERLLGGNPAIVRTGA